MICFDLIYFSKKVHVSMLLKTIRATLLVTRDKRHYKGSGDTNFHIGPQQIDQTIPAYICIE